jgi:hypothetical protein
MRMTQKLMEHYFLIYGDIPDMELVDVLRNLMKLFIEIVNGFDAENMETIKSKLKDWITSYTRFVQALFVDFCWGN